MKADTNEEVLKVLKGSMIFGRIDSQRLREHFLPAMKPVVFKKQEPQHTFNTEDYFYVVAMGLVHGFYIDGSAERKISLFMIRPGGGFDIITVLEGRAAKISYACLVKEVRCLEVPIEMMRTWANEEPEIAKALLLYTGHLLLQLEELIVDLSLCDTGTRLAKLLLKQARATPQKNHGTMVLHRLTHEELASLIGSVRVVVSRQVQKLRKKSLIEVKRGKIIIKDLKALMEMIEHRSRNIKR